ncbi:MAG: hypothetical protein U1E67_12875 [Hyphomicrobiales bacterium]
MFFRGSRYEPIADTTLATKDGRTIRYKRMRFIPQPQSPPRLFTKVQLGERPDLIAYRMIGDPEQFWRLCDLNLVRRPVDLTAVPGASVAIPSPEGGG